MLDGLDRVWRAAEALAGADAGLRVRLGAARAELAAALRRPEQWPDGLLRQARGIARLLRVDGGLDPLDVLDAGLARQVAEDILSLVADVAAFAERGSAAAKATHAEAVAVPGPCLLVN